METNVNCNVKRGGNKKINHKEEKQSPFHAHAFEKKAKENHTKKIVYPTYLKCKQIVVKRRKNRQKIVQFHSNLHLAIAEIKKITHSRKTPEQYNRK